MLFLNKKLYVRKNLYIRNLIPKNKYRIQKKSKMANYRILTKNDLRNHYFAIGEEALKRIDVDQPITLICNGKTYENRNIDKSLGFGHLYARKEFFDDNKLEVDDRLVFDIEESSNTIRIMVIKSDEIIDFDSESKATSTDTSFSKERFIRLINELRNIFKENEWCFRASEENVRAELIDPILKALGWRMPYLRREFDHKDYVLCNDKYLGDNSLKLIIEAKKYREQLLTDKKAENASQKNIEQIMEYMTENDDNAHKHIKNIPYGILTNGIRWCFFANPGNTSPQYMGEINILKSDKDTICHFFEAFSNHIDKNMMNNLRLEKNEEDDKKPEKIIVDFVNIGNTENIFFESEKKTKTYIKKKKNSSHADANYDVARICKNKKHSLSDKKFFRDITVTKTTYRTHNDIASGDYGIYEKLTLLQEINSTLDLGLTITAE